TGEGPLRKYGFLFWSPNSRQLDLIASDVRKISIDNGLTSTITRQVAPFLGAAWQPEGESIVTTGALPMRLYEVPSRGGVPKLFVQPEAPDKQHDFVTPSFVPSHDGSRWLLYSVDSFKPDIFLEDRKNGSRVFIASGAWPVYSPTGHIIYQK